VREALADAPGADGSVIRPAAAPLHPSGGLVILKGNLCPDGALIKIAGLKSLAFDGRARVFESEEDAASAVRTRAYEPGDVIVIRNEGPVGGPGMREMLGVTALLYGQGMGERVALLTDGGSPARRAGSASATLVPRPRSAGRSRSSRAATGSASTRA
jgi:dihydroxy-acid dehydratase